MKNITLPGVQKMDADAKKNEQGNAPEAKPLSALELLLHAPHTHSVENSRPAPAPEKKSESKPLKAWGYSSEEGK